MKFEDINKRFTELAMEYIGKGYHFNTQSMRDSQGELGKVDLTNGHEIIRIMMDSVIDESGEYDVSCVSILVGRYTKNDVVPDATMICTPSGTGTLRRSTKNAFTSLKADSQAEAIFILRTVTKQSQQWKSGFPDTAAEALLRHRRTRHPSSTLHVNFCSSARGMIGGVPFVPQG